MKLKRHIRKAAIATLRVAWVLPIMNHFRFTYRGVGAILMIHRVVPDHHLNSFRGSIDRHELPVSALDSVLTNLVKKGYRVLSMDQALEILARRTSPGGDRFVVITFDDGYADLWTTAYPMLKRHAVPFTIYVTTDMPEKKCVLWWYLLHELVSTRESMDFNVQGVTRSFCCRSREEKSRTYAFLHRMLLGLPASQATEIVKILCDRYMLDVSEYSSRLSLSWNDIVNLSKDDLVTIGAHTMSHPRLPTLTAETAAEEISRSRSILAEQIGKPVNHFSYPFGAMGKREYDIIREAGWVTAATTFPSCIMEEHARYLHALPRIAVECRNAAPESAWERLEVSLSGVEHAFDCRFRRFVPPV